MSAELAVSYAALILADEGIEITSDKLAALVKASGVEVEPYWFTLFAKVLSKMNVDEMLSNVGAGGAAPVAGGAAPASAGAGPAAAAAAAPEPEEESDEDMGFSLFD